jgi:hypothetical protein
MAGVQPEITGGSREDAHALTNMAWPEAASFLPILRRAKVRPSSKKRQPRHQVQQTVQQTKMSRHINLCFFNNLRGSSRRALPPYGAPLNILISF